MFAALAAAETGSKEESDLCGFLHKMLGTAAGSALLQSAVPYAAAGLAAASPSVRKLACSQMGRAMIQLDSRGDDAGTAMLPDLVEVLGDADSSVAAAAADALATLAGGPPPSTFAFPGATGTGTVSRGTPPRSASENILAATLALLSPFAATHSTPEVRLRAYSLAASIAGRTPAAAAAVAGCGLMDALLREVGNEADILAAMAAMEVLAELAEHGTEETAAGLGLVGPLLPELARLAAGRVRKGDDDDVPSFMRARAATVGARIASAAGNALGELPAPGGVELLAALAVAAADEDKQVAEAAMVAAGTLGASAAGAAFMVASFAASPANMPGRSSLLALVAEAALGAAGASRVAALHSLASIAGAGTGSGRRSPPSAGARGTPAAPHDPVGVCTSGGGGNDGLPLVGGRQLSASQPISGGGGVAAESAIRDAAYDAAALRGSTPAERVWCVLERGGDAFLERRIAAYRLVAALGRRGWFAAEVAAHDALFAKILDSGGETTPPGCMWRHEAAVGLLAAAQAPRTAGVELAMGESQTARLVSAVAGGVYGTGGGRQAAIPQVATIQR